MTDEPNGSPDPKNIRLGEQVSEGGEGNEQPRSGSTDTDLVEKLVADRVKEALKDIKGKLDSAYSKRDEALAKAAELEKKERDREVARLKEEGKLKEAFEMQLAEEKARREALEKQNIELTRDAEVQRGLVHLNFRNDSAREMASRIITDQLVRNESGSWVHRSGVSITDFVKAFAESEENSFLFKPRVSSGSGASPSSQSTGAPAGGKSNSLFNMSQEEVIKLAAEGKLPHQAGRT